jgi:uncharacterized protein
LAHDSQEVAAVADDELNTPLGRHAAKKQRRAALPAAVPWAAAGALGLFIFVCAGWAVMVKDPLGGEPIAVVAAGPVPEKSAPTNTAPAMPVIVSPDAVKRAGRRYDGPETRPTQTQESTPELAAAPPAATPAPGTKTVTIIDGSTGKRQEVAIPGLSDARAPVDQRLLENSRHGIIPRVAVDGMRPAEAYARAAAVLAGQKEGPRIAIVLIGLGISANLTRQAIETLPPSVTFAFPPYGYEVDRAVTRARANGHETLLQVPMEPIDYPDNDPGPQTLLTSLNAEQNIDRLHWLMSRFQGYVGIVNYMGGRFLTAEQSLGPVLRETAKRGLIVVDDGSVPRSLASQITAANNLTFAKAEITLDAVPTPTHIDQALARLEALARERGSAVGVASTLPASIERIAEWAKTAGARGILLVPISAVANKSKSS